MIGALIMGLVAGAIARLLVPGDNKVSGCLPTMLLGFAGSFVGYWAFRLIRIGDDDMFDLGGTIGAVIGAVILLVAWQFIDKQRSSS